jgi:hypothetical protein
LQFGKLLMQNVFLGMLNSERASTKRSTCIHKMKKTKKKNKKNKLTHGTIAQSETNTLVLGLEATRFRVSGF